MLRDPKTLPGAATVGEVRAVLANPRVQMVLLADGAAFVGAITELPDDAAADQSAAAFVDKNVETITPDTPGDTAAAQALASPNRRVVVIDDNQTLFGLLCLNASRTGFCRSAPAATAGP